MALVQDDHVAQAVAANAPDQPFDIRMLPRTAGGDYDLFDPPMLSPLPKGRAIDAVPIVQQIPRGFVPWERVDELLCSPLGGGMLRHVDMHHPSPVMDQDEQVAASRGPTAIGSS